MYSSLVLSAALIAPAAPVPRDAVPNATGPAPCVLALKADTTGAVRVIGTIPVKVTVTSTQIVLEGDKQVQKQIDYDTVTTQYFNKTLAEFNGKFATADGKALTYDEALGRVKAGATVLASADGKPISKVWLQSVGSDTVVMTAEGLSHANIQWGGAPYPTTPAPRLTMLATDAKGTVLAQTTSQPNNGDGNMYYADEMQFEGRAFRGKRGGYGYYGGVPADVKVVTKPLAEVKFDAYDLTGKLLSKSDVTKRLAAGGMVIVAGDNRMPDETYLKGFREDMIVLVGAELVLPINPLDQTKKKEPVKPMGQPAPVAPNAPVPLPVVQPAIIKQRIQPVILPAPAVQEKAQPATKPDVEKK